jgi:hypothetical protein
MERCYGIDTMSNLAHWKRGRMLRTQWVLAGAALTIAWFGTAAGEVVFDQDALSAESSAYYASPSVPSIVFVSPEAREAGMEWLPSNTPFVPVAPLILRAQPQSGGAYVSNRPPAFGSVPGHPPNVLAANAAVNAAHSYKFGLGDNLACPQNFLMNFGLSFGNSLLGGRNCLGTPYLPLAIAPPGFNRPTDRPSNSAAAARAVEQAHRYRFGN